MKKLKFTTPNEVIDKIQKGERDFSNIKVVGLELIGKKLDGISFRGSDMEGCRLRGCSLVGADFREVKMNIADFVRADLTKANFANAKLDWVAFPEAILDNTDFRNAVLLNVLFVDSNVVAADLSGATMLNVLKSRPEITKEKFDRWASVFSNYRWPHATQSFFKTMTDGMKKTYFSPLRLAYLEGRRILGFPAKDYKQSLGEEFSGFYSKASGAYGKKSSDYTAKGSYSRKKSEKEKKRANDEN